MIQKLLAIVLVVGGANIVFFEKGFPHFGSVGFFLLILFYLFLIFASFFKQQESKRQNFAVGAGFLSLFAAGLSLLRANEIDQMLLSYTSLFCAGICTYLFALGYEVFGSIAESLVAPLRVLAAWFRSFGTLALKLPSVLSWGVRKLPIFALHKQLGEETSGSIIRGAFITTCVLFVLVVLLSSADPIFANAIKNLFSFEFPKFVISVPDRIRFTLIVAVLAAPFAFLSIPKKYHSPFQQKDWGKMSLEFSMLVGAVSLVLGFFLLIQFRYLFLAVPDITLQKFGIATYSEYVRKGFGELSMVAGITYLVIAGSMVVLRHAEARGKLLRRLDLILLGETIVFILAIFRRVLLYQAEHGLTRIRLYGTVFLVVLIILTIILVLRHLIQKKQDWYLAELGTCLGALLFLALFNVDNAIATIFKPTVNKEVDYTYIARLSPDASAGWIEALRSVEKIVTDPYIINAQSFTDEQARDITYANRTMFSLMRSYEDLVYKYGSKEEMDGLGNSINYSKDFSYVDINVGEWNAYQKIRKEFSSATVKSYFNTMQILYGRLNQVQQQQQYDRSSQTPLVR